jgi:WD40 repeat protein
MADRTLTAAAVPGTLQFATDGATISALCRDNTIRTWVVETGQLKAEKKVPARSALLAADRWAERGDAGTVRVWDLTADRQLQIMNSVAMSRAALSGDGRWLATADTAGRRVEVREIASGKKVHTLPDGIGGAATLRFSPDGGLLVSTNYDNDVRIWKTSSGELVKKIEDLTGAMFAAEFTPDGQRLILAGLDETVYIWDAKTFGLIRKLGGHGETISALAISPDGKTLVTGGFDVLAEKNPVKVVFWDLTSGKILRTVRAPHRVASLAFSPNGKWVAMAAGENEIGLWAR